MSLALLRELAHELPLEYRVERQMACLAERDKQLAAIEKRDRWGSDEPSATCGRSLASGSPGTTTHQPRHERT